jgi:hypothetical protein
MRKPLSDETKKKISEAKKGKGHSDETKEKIRKGTAEARRGLRNPPSDKQRLKNMKSDVRAHYGLSWDEYQAMVEAHNNVCAICKQPETSISSYGTPKRLTIDHCHTTDRIRGLLCDGCNRGIGHLREDISILQNAIEYLKG